MTQSDGESIQVEEGTSNSIRNVMLPPTSNSRQNAIQAISDYLRGIRTKGALVDWTGYSRNTIYNRLNVLEAAGHVVVVHEGTRLFELESDPRICD